MQYPKIVLILAAFAATFYIAPQTYASPFQDTKQTASNGRKTVPAEYYLKLKFEDAAFREFVRISPEQLELLGSLSKEWAVERKRLLDAGASYRDQYRALEAKEATLTDTFTEFQQQRMLRFNLITSWGFEEFGMLERANAAEDLTVTEAQIQKLQS
ncbi:MAG: hypothetical protein Q8M16_10280, partial [Pirellulaceae bacterium]|nr:hypothetical protein [Pirellulaceae bacterium]